MWQRFFGDYWDRSRELLGRLSPGQRLTLGILGATVFMLFHLLLMLGILPAGLQSADGTTVGGVTPWIIYPLAWASGFKENRIFDLVDRVIKRIFSGKEEEPVEPPDFGWEPPE